MWTDRYIGLPFEPNGRDYSGVDCWGLVYLVYRHEFGIELPLYEGVYPDQSIHSIQGAHNHIDEVKGDFHVVTEPQEHDIILIRIYGNLVSHVGLYLGKGEMLHIMSGIDSTVERIAGTRWKNRISGYRRYVSHG